MFLSIKSFTAIALKEYRVMYNTFYEETHIDIFSTKNFSSNQFKSCKTFFNVQFNSTPTILVTLVQTFSDITMTDLLCERDNDPSIPSVMY